MGRKLERFVAHCPHCGATCDARKFYSNSMHNKFLRGKVVPLAKEYALSGIVGHIQHSHRNIRVSKPITITEEIS